MFRAAPEQTELINVEEINDEINLTLSKYDSVPTSDGQKVVHDLTSTDVIIMHEGAVEVQCKIKSIIIDKGQANLKLELIS